MRLRRFHFIQQNDHSDCGLACLAMVCHAYGRPVALSQLKSKTALTRQGLSVASLCNKAINLGFDALEVRTSLDKLEQAAPLPVIVHWKGDHFVVVHKITSKHVYVADPAKGRAKLTREKFLQNWLPAEEGLSEGIALVVQPTESFFHADDRKKVSLKLTLSFITNYLEKYKKNVAQLIIGLLLGSCIQVMLPFLTQAIVDKGITHFDVNFIFTVLALQFVLYASSTVIEFVRTWIFIHLSTRINVFIISDFLAKLMRLPVSFFDSKIIGDLTQRINDHKRIEQFITDTLIRSLFSVFTILVFGGILFYFNSIVFLIFFAGTVIQLTWIFFFLKKMRMLDYESFAYMAKDNSKIFEIITGMQEVKLNNLEKQKKEEWKDIQSSLFGISQQKLKINQYEQGGTRFIGYMQIIMIIFFAALAVINGSMTLGAMMSILFIVGQLNAPVSQLINFILSMQMAKISLGRLAEVHEHDDEEPSCGACKITTLPVRRSLTLSDVRFAYAEGNEVLKGINMHIPQGKVTAIVGLSGSGKTTLVKLLLKFYQPQSGSITIDDTELSHIKNSVWRDKCGTVLQDSFIFSDSIAYNISLEREWDMERLNAAAKAANIYDFIQSIPLQYKTRIGQDGFGISHGQKQRILIARAIYKNPQYLFFDEATNSLDARNEYTIMKNLRQFFVGRTVVIVAHRLSTVKNADQIVVLDEGVIAETGTHEELMLLGEKYFALVQSQVELGVKDVLNISEV